MFCVFCEEEVEDFEFNCLRHAKCPCEMVMLDCSEVIAYKQLDTFREQRIESKEQKTFKKVQGEVV